MADYKKEPALYIFTNKVNGKKYVGETINMYIRCNAYKNTNKRNRPINNALRKYGFDGFDLKVMYFKNITKEELLDLEETFIFLESSLCKEHGYNVCERGQDNRGRVVSEETRKKISELKKGKIQSLETCKKRSESLKGKARSAETRKKISESHIGKKHTRETLIKISKAVLQYSKDNKFIKEWLSATDAARSLNTSQSNIWNCIKGKRKTAAGFIWKYKLSE